MGRILLVPMLTMIFLAPAIAEEERSAFEPEPPVAKEWDWIQTTSGEWLKGKLIEMYDDNLEFDSDEFDEVSLEWKKVQQVRTAGVMQIGLLHGVAAIGKLVIDGDTVRVIGDDGEQTFARADVITIAAGAPKEINHWSAKVMLGLNARQGNTDVTEATTDARFTRRTVRSRLDLDYIANFNDTEGEQVANNHRVKLDWNVYISDRLYASPLVFEWFRDPFQNIDHRETLGAGVGYELIHTPKTDWEVSGGPGYQKTTFDSVAVGSENPEDTPALIVGTVLDIELTRWMDLFYEYRFQIVNEKAGQYNQHMLTSFETDLTKRLDFDVTFVWDRIEKPRENDAGLTPAKDDFKLTIGVTLDW